MLITVVCMNNVNCVSAIFPSSPFPFPFSPKESPNRVSAIFHFTLFTFQYSLRRY